MLWLSLFLDLSTSPTVDPPSMTTSLIHPPHLHIVHVVVVVAAVVVAVVFSPFLVDCKKNLFFDIYIYCLANRSDLRIFSSSY